MRRGTLSAPQGETDADRIAGIDVHKKMLAVVVADVEIDGDFHFDREKVGTTPADLRGLADWLVEQDVEEVVMELTAQDWRPVWEALEQHWRPRRRARDGAPRLAGTLHLAQAQSKRGPGGRKRDFPDAERLVKRLVAQELTLSFAPDTEQRLWRTVMRRRYQLTRNRVQLHNRLEALLEEAHIKVSSIVSDLLGISTRRMLQALADGERDPAALAEARGPALAGHAGAAVRCLPGVSDTASGLPSAAEAHAGRTARDRGSPRTTRSTDGRPATKNGGRPSAWKPRRSARAR